jgi:hypothetical protein
MFVIRECVDSSNLMASIAVSRDYSSSNLAELLDALADLKSSPVPFQESKESQAIPLGHFIPLSPQKQPQNFTYWIYH